MSPGRTDPQLHLSGSLELMRLVWAVDQALQKTSKRMEATLGITGPQRLVLRLLGRFPGLAMGRLAELMLVHPSTVTGIVKRLQGRGLVERRVDGKDRRRAFLYVTRKGSEWSVDQGGTVETAVKRVLSSTAPVKVRHAREFLVALAARLERANEASAARPGRRRVTVRSARP
jgi:DNA-binding transcriptional ArsR family regulator